MSIHQKALADITWTDLEALVRDGVPEGPSLDYKRTLSHPDGDDPWIRGQGRIGRPARDELAIAVVAFANAYGGTVLLGVDEGTGNTGIPERLSPLPRAADLAERLHRAISDVIDPPMPGFLVVPILEPEGEGGGVIALRVAASDAAPHGVGSPPNAYVRRGASATPMTMRDIQSVFWDARTRRERIDAIRARESAALALGMGSGSALQALAANLVVDPDGLLARCTAIAHHPLMLPLEALRDTLPEIRLTASAFGSGWALPFGGGHPPFGWRPRAHGFQAIDDGPSLWTVLQDGTISVIGVSPGDSRGQATQLQFPGTFAQHAAQIVVMADWLRREAGRPDIPVEIDIEFLNSGEARGYDGQGLGHVNPAVEIGPVLLTNRSGAESTFRELEQQIWNGFGLTHVDRARVNFKKWFDREP